MAKLKLKKKAKYSLPFSNEEMFMIGAVGHFFIEHLEKHHNLNKEDAINFVADITSNIESHYDSLKKISLDNSADNKIKN
jgi:hypothetical protein